MKKRIVPIILLLFSLFAASTAEARLTLGVVIDRGSTESGVVSRDEAQYFAGLLVDKLDDSIVVREMNDSAMLLKWLDQFASLDLAILSAKDVGLYRNRFLVIGPLDEKGDLHLVARSGVPGSLPLKLASIIQDIGFSPWRSGKGIDDAPSSPARPVIPPKKLVVDTVQEVQQEALEPVDVMKDKPAPQKPLIVKEALGVDNIQGERKKLLLAVVPGIKGFLQNSDDAGLLAESLEASLPVKISIKTFDRQSGFLDWFQRYQMVDLAILPGDFVASQLEPNIHRYARIVGQGQQGDTVGDVLVSLPGRKPELLKKIAEHLYEWQSTDRGQELFANLGISHVALPDGRRPSPDRQQIEETTIVSDEPEPPAITKVPEPFIVKPTDEEVVVPDQPYPPMSLRPVTPPVVPELSQMTPSELRASETLHPTPSLDTLAQPVSPEPLQPPVQPTAPDIAVSQTIPDVPVAPGFPVLPDIDKRAAIDRAPGDIVLPDIAKSLPASAEPPIPAPPEIAPIVADSPLPSRETVPQLSEKAPTVHRPQGQLEGVEDSGIISSERAPVDEGSKDVVRVPTPHSIVEEPTELLSQRSEVDDGEAQVEPEKAPTEVISTGSLLDDIETAQKRTETEPQTTPSPDWIPPQVVSDEQVIQEVLEFAEPVTPQDADPITPFVSEDVIDIPEEEIVALLGEEPVVAMVSQPDLPIELRPSGVPVVRPGRVRVKPSLEKGLFLTSLPDAIPEKEPVKPPQLLPAAEPEPDIIYIVPFMTVMVPKEVNERIFDRFIDAMLAEENQLETNFVILKGGLQSVEPDWLSVRRYVTGEIYAYVEDVGGTATDLRAKARITYRRPNRDDPVLSYEYPASRFIDHNISTLDKERVLLADEISKALIDEFITVLKN